jgi:hypothetical protein
MPRRVGREDELELLVLNSTHLYIHIHTQTNNLLNIIIYYLINIIYIMIYIHTYTYMITYKVAALRMRAADILQRSLQSMEACHAKLFKCAHSIFPDFWDVCESKCACFFYVCVECVVRSRMSDCVPTGPCSLFPTLTYTCIRASWSTSTFIHFIFRIKNY